MIALRAWEKPGNDDGGGGSSFRLGKAGGCDCDAMRCDVMPRKSPGSRAGQDCAGAMYFYKTRRLVWSCRSCCSEVLKSQCRSVVGHLAMKIKVAFSREARWLRDGRCRAVGERLGRLDSVEKAGGIKEEGRQADWGELDIYKYICRCEVCVRGVCVVFIYRQCTHSLNTQVFICIYININVCLMHLSLSLFGARDGRR